MKQKKIRFIAAMDSTRGIANAKGIPWDLPMDKAYYRKKIAGGNILMGFNTYLEIKRPYPESRNFVYCRAGSQLAPGFIPVYELHKFIKEFDESIWIIGGAKLFASTLRFADQLYITQIDQNFRCAKKFPQYYPAFRRVSQSPDHHQNALTFRFEVWERVSL